jgi:ketosteroid isomerase-like protein
MPTSRRSILAAAGGLAGLDIAAAQPHSSAATDRTIADLIQRSTASNAALMKGDIERYLALESIADDFTLMSPFGGAPTHARDLTADRIEAMGRFFRNGSFRQELVQAYGCADMVVLAVIEHAHVEVGGLLAQDWSLRVTLVYRREGAEWRLAHRHADPLVAGISLERSAALARGAG